MEKIKIKYDWWEAELLIKNDEETINKMKEQLLFWMDGEQRISYAGGDIKKAFLIMLGERLIRLSSDWNIKGVKSEIAEAEGWEPLDGSYGVELIKIDEWEFLDSEFGIESMKEG